MSSTEFYINCLIISGSRHKENNDKLLNSKIKFVTHKHGIESNYLRSILLISIQNISSNLLEYYFYVKN